MSEPTRGPLGHIRVLELGHIVAGPTASLILAELGADVIKIERPGGGDQARFNKSNQGHFVSYNSNKRSAVLDIQTEAGKAALLELVRGSDVLIDNFAPGALDRLGLGYAVLSASNPRLIHASIKGFLPGPYGERALTDEPAQMMGGLAYMTGPMGRPLRAGTSVVDIVGAMFAVIAVLTALNERQQSNRGRQIHVGLFESVVFLVGQHIAKATMTGEVPVPMPERGMGREFGWGIYRTFVCKDQRNIFIAVLSDAHWERFCEAFHLHDLWQDTSLRTSAGRSEQHERLRLAVETLVGNLSSSEVTARLEKAGLPFAPVNTPYDLASDPHLAAISFLQEVLSPEGHRALVAGLPIRTQDWFATPRRNPPVLGSDTIDVLSAANLG